MLDCGRKEDGQERKKIGKAKGTRGQARGRDISGRPVVVPPDGDALKT